MTLLQQISIRFKADSADATKKIEKLDQSTKKLGTDTNKTGRETDKLNDKLRKVGNQSKKTGDGFDKLARSVKGTVAAYLSFAAIKGATLGNAAFVDDLGKTADRLNMNVSELDAFSEASVRFGGTRNGLQNDFRILSRQMNNFARDGSGAGARTFKRFGFSQEQIKNMKNSGELLEALAGKIKEAGLNNQQITGIGRTLGLSIGSIAMLQAGNEAIAKQVQRQKDLGVVTQKDAKIAAEFNDQWADVTQQLKFASISFSSAILPVVTDFLKIMERVVTFLRENKEFTMGFFGTIATFLAARFIPVMLRTAATTLIAAAPFLLMAGVVAAVGVAIGLVVDDFMNFKKGSKSVIGAVVNFTKEKFNDLMKRLAEIKDSIVKTFTGIFEAVKKPFVKVFDFIMDKLQKLESLVPDFVKDGFSFFFGGEEKKKTTNITVGKNDVPQLDSPIKQKINNSLKGAGDLILLSRQGDNAIQQSGVNSQQPGNNQNISIDKIEIQTNATDSDEIASSISTKLKEAIQRTQINLNDGVKV